MSEIEEASRLEIAHTEGTHLAGTIGSLHGMPCAKHITVSLMNEQEVNVVGAQLAQAFVNGGRGTLLTIVTHPHLGDNKQLVASNARLGNRIAHSLLVVVCLCRVDETITHRKGVTHTALGLLRWHLKHAIT